MPEIAPVLFKALPDGASITDSPSVECFNAGAPAEAVAAVTTPFRAPGLFYVGAALAAVSTLAPIAWFLHVLIHFRERPLVLTGADEWLGPLSVPAEVLLVAGIALMLFAWSPLSPAVRAWRKNLDTAWANHGADLTDLGPLHYEDRVDARKYCETLEKLRVSLNKLNPEGDELDVARYRLQQFIEVSDTSYIGKRAAAAPHITDPKVRQAAKEYKALEERKKLARRAVTDEITALGQLLVDRLQAKKDAEIVRLVHGR